MASINKVFLLGNLGQDPDVRYLESGTAVATLNLATNRSYKNRDGQPVTETEWHRVVLFGRTAELAKDYLRKGRSVFIEGRLRTRKWTDQNGIERYTTEIVCDNMQFVGSRSDAPSAGGYNDGFESAPRPAPRPATAPQPAPAPAPQPSPIATTASIDQLEEDVPF